MITILMPLQVAAIANFHGEVHGRIGENGRVPQTIAAAGVNEPRGHCSQVAGKTVDKRANRRG